MSEGQQIEAMEQAIESMDDARRHDLNSISSLTARVNELEQALRDILMCDYRGNMPREQEIARRALAEKGWPVPEGTVGRLPENYWETAE